MLAVYKNNKNLAKKRYFRRTKTIFLAWGYSVAVSSEIDR